MNERIGRAARGVWDQIAKNLAFWRRWGGIAAPLLLLASGAELIHFAPGGTQAARPDFFPLLLEAVFHASLALWVLWALQRARLTPTSTALWLLAMAVCFLYIRITPYTLRTHDARGHLAYVEIIAIGLRIPSPADCWVCYHPPFYYLAVAPFFRVFLMTPDLAANKELQYLGGYIFGLQLIYFFRLVETYLTTRLERVGAALLVICLPLTALSSGRLGNDIMLYLLWMAAVYHMARWEDTLELRRLVAAFAFLSLGLVTKMSIAAPAAAVALAMVTTFVRRPGHRLDILRQGLKSLALPIVPLAGYFYWSRTFITNGITGNLSGMWYMFRIHPSAAGILTFPLRPFFLAFAHPTSNSGGREYFWVFWLKTALVESWGYHQPNTHFWLRGLALFVLILIALGAVMAARNYRHLLRTTPSVLLWVVVISPLFSLGYWISTRFSSSGDARYVYPLFPIAAVVFSQLQAGSRERGDGLLLLAAYAAEALFLLCGAAFLFCVLWYP